MKKILVALTVLCLLVPASIGLTDRNAVAEPNGAANFRSYDMTRYPQGGFDLSPAHARSGLACASCHESSDPLAKPVGPRWPSGAKCAGCHKMPSGSVTVQDYKTNAMRSFDPHDSHVKGGCLTCHSEHFASRLSCNTGGCHDFRDLRVGKRGAPRK